VLVAACDVALVVVVVGVFVRVMHLSVGLLRGYWRGTFGFLGERAVESKGGCSV